MKNKLDNNAVMGTREKALNNPSSTIMSAIKTSTREDVKRVFYDSPSRKRFGLADGSVKNLEAIDIGALMMLHVGNFTKKPTILNCVKKMH